MHLVADFEKALREARDILLDPARASIAGVEESDPHRGGWYQAAPTPTWAHPVILGMRVLIKDRTTLISLSFAGAGD